jgi:2-C-methyl-D-erythritol 4-phosphate cytidylyltransferase/2-C-methyl-D-erythritol 2,4-cyclodiphosphate synthase
LARHGGVSARRLEALSSRSPDIVLVHDAARPFASADLIAQRLRQQKRPARHPGAAGDRYGQTPWPDGTIENHRPGTLRLVQTPQARLASTRCSTLTAARPRKSRTISPTMPRWPNGPADRDVFAGRPATSSSPHRKISRALVTQSAMLGDVRTGSGLDVHAFGQAIM